MDDKQIRRVLTRYRTYFTKHGVVKQECEAGIKLKRSVAFFDAPQGVRLEHCHAMLDEMEQFLKEGRREKLMRWLGFMQGVLWSTGCYTLEELKNHNRP